MHVEFSCWQDTWAFTDFVLVVNGGVLIVECDENQHDGYGVICDVARMSKIHTAFVLGGNTLPVGIIRYNPDAYKVDDKARKINQRDKEAQLVDKINN